MVIAVRSTAIAAFASMAEAESALSEVLAAGFEPGQVGIVLPDAEASLASSGQTTPTSVWVGTMFRSLVGVEIPDDEIRYYEEALQAGQTLVMVRARERYPEAMEILHRHGGEYMAAF